MTKVVFETATIADAIKAAERVAPAKGQAFDKAAGILISVSMATEAVIVQATNTEVFHMAWIDYVSAEGESAKWRVPSRLFAGVMASLPIGSNKTVTFEGDGRKLKVSQGHTKATFNLIDHTHYPTWEAFDPDGLIVANDLGGRIAQVEWAAAKTEIPFSGVYLDGTQAVSTDRYRLARVPLEVPGLQEPITVPSGILGSILKQTGEVSVGVAGEQLLIMPDEHTQIRTIVYASKYPNVQRIMDNFRSRPEVISFDRSELLPLIERALNFVGSDRAPTLRIYVGKETLAVYMQNAEIGMLGDILELPGQCQHDRVELRFTPKNLTDALNSSPNDKVSVGYNPAKVSELIYIDGGSGYEAWVMPRMELGEK